MGLTIPGGPLVLGRGGGLRVKAAGAAAFSPASYTGLKLDLNASQIAGKIDGDALSAWNDSSGQGNNFAQGTGSQQPLYKTNIFGTLPAVRFDGTDDNMVSASLAAVFPTAATLYIVAQLTAESKYGLYSTTGNSSFWRFSDGNGYNGVFRATRINNYPASPFMPTSGKHVFAVRSDASAFQVFLDGTGAGAQAAGYSPGTTHWVGCGTDGTHNLDTAQALAGDVARVLAYSAAHSAADMAAISASLKTLYGTV